MPMKQKIALLVFVFAVVGPNTKALGMNYIIGKLVNYIFEKDGGQKTLSQEQFEGADESIEAHGKYCKNKQKQKKKIPKKKSLNQNTD